MHDQIAELDADAGLEGKGDGLGVLERERRREELCPHRMVQARSKLRPVGIEKAQGLARAVKSQPHVVERGTEAGRFTHLGVTRFEALGRRVGRRLPGPQRDARR